MAYILGQYVYPGGVNTTFADFHTVGQVMRYTKDRPIYDTSSMTFYDECLYTTNEDSQVFKLNKNYYCHCKVQRRTEEDQILTIKLIHAEVTSEAERKMKQKTDSKEQYIKAITINKGSLDEFVDIEFIFTPMDSFNCLAFELQRIQSDYREAARFPKIIYVELSIINNIITGVSDGMKLPEKTKLIKMGVQSRPGLVMCINGEEIRNSRTGIFEIKNGVMTVSSFSVINAAVEKKDSEGKDSVERAMENIVYQEQVEKKADENIWSVCCFNTEKVRTLDSFTLDYMYQAK